MSVETRKERERRDRHDRIIAAARRLAEAEGWDAVTTRRLAGLIDYSQPVLYSHFARGKSDIMRAVALEGFLELAAVLKAARTGTTQAAAPRALCRAYLDFATAFPALYEAMFVLPIDLEFATEKTPAVLRSAFGEFVAVVTPSAGPTEPLAELLWSALHGIAVLSRSSRIPEAGREARLDLLVGRMVGAGKAH